MSRPLRASLIIAAIALSGCGKSASPSGTAPVSAAKQSVFYAQQLISQSLGTTTGGRPGALLGTYVSSFLASTAGVNVKGAKAGVSAGLALLLANQQTTSDTFALLQSLGTVLQVDIQDMLNRSADRKTALDTYSDTLANLLAQSKTTAQALSQQEAALENTLRSQQSNVSNIQNQLNNALSKQDYTTASNDQQQIIEAQTSLSKTDAEDRQLKSTIQILQKLNAAAEQRLAAIKANREILIAGLHVQNVPGLTDIGVINQASSRGGGTFGNAVFGGAGELTK